VGHHLHARLVTEALDAGKHVFVEKPLAMNVAELERITDAVRRSPDRQAIVGYNRRFSPHTVKMRALLAARSGPLCMNMTINAGEIPPEHWTQDPERGGGRIIGEACHFIDLLCHIADSPVATVSAAMVGEGPAVREDKVSIVLGLADGSIGTVNYFSNGPRSYPKEMLEVFSDGRALRLDNFRTTKGYGFHGFSGLKTPRQDKGHTAEIAAFVDRLRTGGPPLMAFDRLRNVSLASFAAVRAAREHGTIAIESSTGEVE
jgi:predicted dehydrogenase